MIFPVFLHARTTKAQGHDEKNHSGDFEPQLVKNVAEGSCRGADRAHHGFQGAITSGLPARDASHCAQFAPCGNLGHTSILAASGDTMTRLQGATNRSAP